MKRILFAVVLSCTAYAAWSFGPRATTGRTRTHTSGRTVNAAAVVSRTAKAPTPFDPYAEFRDSRYSNEGLLSEQDEIQLGAKLHVEILKKFKVTEVGQTRLAQIGKKTAVASLRPRLVYHFYVINSREINAFSGPGGYVYVTTATMKLANDDELAAVVSHEIGHVVARHSLKSIQKSEEMN